MVDYKYSTAELMAVTCSYELKDQELVFVGVGIPMMAGLLANKTHARDMIIVYEGGGVGAISRRLAFTISDNSTTDNALLAGEMWRIFADTQRGLVDTGVLGGAQIDKYGNINTTAIIGDKTYQEPAIRLPGSGGGNDIASLCGKTIIVMRLGKSRFVSKADYITSTGYITGGDSREKSGLKWGGPACVVTDKCVLRFDKISKEMYLYAVYPGVTVEDVKDNVQWDLKIADNVIQIPPPPLDYLEKMRKMDPNGVILGGKTITQKESFDDFYCKMKKSYQETEIQL